MDAASITALERPWTRISWNAAIVCIQIFLRKLKFYYFVSFIWKQERSCRDWKTVEIGRQIKYRRRQMISCPSLFNSVYSWYRVFSSLQLKTSCQSWKTHRFPGDAILDFRWKWDHKSEKRGCVGSESTVCMQSIFRFKPRRLPSVAWFLSKAANYSVETMAGGVSVSRFLKITCRSFRWK